MPKNGALRITDSLVESPKTFTKGCLKDEGSTTLRRSPFSCSKRQFESATRRLSTHSLIQILEGFVNVRELELEPVVQELARDNAATFDDQFSLRSQEGRSNLQHPFSGWQSDGCSANVA